MTKTSRQGDDPHSAAALRQMVRVALGRAPADLLMAGCQLVNTYAEEIHDADIAIAGGRIVSVRHGSSPEAHTILDCRGLLALPGLIHPCLITDSAGGDLGSVARFLISGGITAAFGLSSSGAEQGVTTTFLETAAPTNEFLWSYYSLATANLTLQAPNPEGPSPPIRVDQDWANSKLPWVRSAAPTHNERYLATMAADLSRVSQPSQVSACAAMGVRGAVGVTTAEEAKMRLRAGMSVFLDHVGDDLLHSTLRQLMGAGLDSYHIGFGPLMMALGPARDGITSPLLDMVRIAVDAGIQPARAVQMASTTAARFYGFDRKLGSIAPGRRADILLLESLEVPLPKTVIVGGRIVRTDRQVSGGPRPE